MKNLYSTVLALGLCILTTDSFSAVAFNDSFEGESDTSIKNYTPFEFWDVSDGTVDLISGADGGFGIPCSNGTKCLDLDGSTANSGILTTKQNFALSAGTYELTFALAGNPLKPQETNSVMVSLGDVFSETISLSGNDPFMTFTKEIIVTADTSGNLSFENKGGDHYGLILDAVALNSVTPGTPKDPGTSAVPLPPAGWLFLSGILGFSVFRKKSTH